MPETRFAEFPALSVDPMSGFLGLHRRPFLLLFFLPLTVKIIIYHLSILLFLTLMSQNVLHRTSFGVFVWDTCDVTSKIRVLTSLLTSFVSCISQWARQKPAPLKIEQTLSRRKMVSGAMECKS